MTTGSVPGAFAAPVIALLAIGAAAYAAFTPSLFNDGDTGWHLAAGDWIMAQRSVPHADPFSFTMRGAPWTAHEWLSEVGMAAAFSLGGWSALAALFPAAIGLTLWISGRALARAVPLRYALLALAGVAAILTPGALARPHVLAWPLLAVWLTILANARAARGPPPLAAALMMTVWANLHASYIIGLGLAGAFALEALVEDRDRRQVIRDWGLFGVLSLAAALVTPHGLQGVLYPFQVSGMGALSLIGEWRAARLPEDLPFALFAAAMAGVGALRWRQVGIVRLLLIAGLAGMGVLHARHQAVFALVAAIAIVPRAFGPRLEEALPRRRGAAAALGMIAALVVLVRLAIPIARPDAANWPNRALDAVPAALRSAPVLNSYSFGGPLILRGIAPFIDGRADMYGDAFTLAHQRMMDGDLAELDRATRRWKLRWAILHPGQRLAARLGSAPGWQRIYADDRAVIFVRRPGEQGTGFRQRQETAAMRPSRRGFGA